MQIFSDMPQTLSRPGKSISIQFGLDTIDDVRLC